MTAASVVVIAVVVTVGVVACFAVTLAVLYKRIVPDKRQPLGNPESIPQEELNDFLVSGAHPYPLDLWPGSAFAELERGKTHYYLLGPEDGKRIVLVHGMTTGWAAFQLFINHIASQGLRVLIYDLYGRGYSAAPGGNYDADMYVSQLEGLLRHVGWWDDGQDFSALGYSLGGGIATAFTARHPEKIHRLILIAPAGLKETLPALVKLATLPVFGDFAAHAFGRKIMLRNMDKKSDATPESVQDFEQSEAVTRLTILKHPGVVRACLSTVKHGLVAGMTAEFEVVGKALGDRVLCIWGMEDDVVDYRVEFPRFKQAMPNAVVIPVPGIRHSIVPEMPKMVAREVKNFLATIPDSDAKESAPIELSLVTMK